MRVMVIVKATEASEVGGMPTRRTLGGHGRVQPVLIEAGVFVDRAGLRNP